MSSQIVLVAFEVDGDTMREAQESLLPRLQAVLKSQDESSPVECWWVAEDERYDGSDNDSAVFVTPGFQPRAGAVLQAHGLTQPYNVVAHDKSATFREDLALLYRGL